MEALHREKALLGHCASAAARSGSICELLLQNKFTLIILAFVSTDLRIVRAEKETCDLSLQGTDCLSYPFETCDEQTSTCVHKNVFP